MSATAIVSGRKLKVTGNNDRPPAKLVLEKRSSWVSGRVADGDCALIEPCMSSTTQQWFLVLVQHDLLPSEPCPGVSGLTGVCKLYTDLRLFSL